MTDNRLHYVKREDNSQVDIESHEINLQAVSSVPQSLSGVSPDFTSDQKYFILRRLNFEGLVSLDDLPIAATFMLEKILALPHQDALKILKKYLVEHDDDVNIPTEEYDFVKNLVALTPLDYETSFSRNETKGEINITHAKEGLSTSELEKLVDEKGVVSNNLDASHNLSSLEAHKKPVLDLFDWDLQVRMEAALIAYHSPYPEVRSVTDPFDDPTVPVETVRAYLAGLIWVAIGTFINQFFSERQPKISLSSAVVQLFLYPTGLILAYILPDWKFKVWKYTIEISPGPWNYKEQMLSTICYSVSGGFSYVSWNIHVQKLDLFYGNDWATFGFQVLLILSSNFLGFGFAGILRKFAVYPIKAIWPSILPTIALNRALMQPEKKENINGWTISKYYWFFAVTTFSFFYFWIPNYLFEALSAFNWLTWISPNNFNLAVITGSVSGLGLNPVPSFDWNIINYNTCLTVPFYSYVNQYIGSLLGFFCIVGLYWTNYYWSGFMPINSNALFTNTGEPYSVQSVVNERSLFDKKKYETYGPPFYTAANLVSYGAFFAIYPFAIIYEIGIRWKEVFKGFASLFHSFSHLRSSTYEDFDDPHSKMMARYKEVPDWYFLLVLIISIVLAILCVKLYPAETPVWGIFFALGINFVFLIPLTAVYSVTGFSFGLNVLVQIIVGYAIPGNGLALIFIKAIGYNIDGQAQNYITDQKLAHYTKLPPRALFRIQMLSVFVTSFIGLGVINYTINNIKDYCVPGQSQKFTCPSSRTFYSASVIWGVIGPKRSFTLYPVLRYCFLIGFLLSIPAVLFKLYAPKKLTKFFQPTLIIGGFLVYAPYNLSYFTGGLYFSIASMYYLRKHYTTWWEKYNYVFSGGMDAGIAFSSIIIFFAVQYHDKSISWWGNNVPYSGQDGLAAARLNATELAPEGYYGPRVGNFP